MICPKLNKNKSEGREFVVNPEKCKFFYKDFVSAHRSWNERIFGRKFHLPGEALDRGFLPLSIYFLRAVPLTF